VATPEKRWHSRCGKLHLRDGRADEKRTDAGNRILVHFSLKMWHLVATILKIFLTINWNNYCIYRLIPDFTPPLKFLWSIAVRSPMGWTPLIDTTGKETCLCPSVRSFVRLLDGVWHDVVQVRGCAPLAYFVDCLKQANAICRAYVHLIQLCRLIWDKATVHILTCWSQPFLACWSFVDIRPIAYIYVFYSAKTSANTKATK